MCPRSAFLYRRFQEVLNVGAWNNLQESGRKAPLSCNAAFSMSHCSFSLAASPAFGKNDFRSAEKQMLQCSFCSATFRNCSATSVFRLWHVAGVGFGGVGFRTSWPVSCTIVPVLGVRRSAFWTSFRFWGSREHPPKPPFWKPSQRARDRKKSFSLERIPSRRKFSFSLEMFILGLKISFSIGISIPGPVFLRPERGQERNVILDWKFHSALKAWFFRYCLLRLNSFNPGALWDPFANPRIWGQTYCGYFLRA